MDYFEYISQFKGQKGTLIQLNSKSIYEFTLGVRGKLFERHHIIQEVGHDFVIVAKHRDNINQGNDANYKRTIIPLSMFVLVLPKGI